jgi:16S rRNA (adenine1518-N6/adenine1519-N6)-dimethyltransferase
VTLTKKAAIELLESYGASPSRALGQNFVVDPNTVRRIARLAGVGPGDRVVEIGPGLGSLTRALVETGAVVTALELDRFVLPILRDHIEPLGVRVVEGDAMDVDWPMVLNHEPHALVANLPYNISVPLICDLLDDQPLITKMLVMVQKEVGERLAASPRTKAYGAVTVKVSYWGTAKLVGTVPPTVFLPQPRVDSALVSIVRHATPAVDPATIAPRDLFELVQMGFGKRRKMLRGSLAGRVDSETFAAAGIRPEARPEELDVHEWGRLAVAAMAVQAKSVQAKSVQAKSVQAKSMQAKSMHTNRLE